jgi:NAD(P)-dependent dehydrogenase (short-subunit alcohol dehydrogenase family)
MSRHVVITGANRGIGLALCQHFLALGDSVTAVCRHASEELSSLSVRVIEHCDVSQADDVVMLQQQLAEEPIDILINNAGILRNESLTDMNFESMVEQFVVNAMGPLRVVTALRNNLRAGSKLALITSRMGSVADNGSGGCYGYRMSKAALNMAGMSLAQDLKGRGVAVALLHPGMVKTEMINYAGDVTPEQAADGLAQRIEELTLDRSGGFWHANGEPLPW